MKQDTLTQRILRLTGLETPRPANRSKTPVDELHAVPHVDYLKEFTHVEWDPTLMGLEKIGMGVEPTLIAAPKWSFGWLKTIECLNDISWDMPLASRMPFEIWDQLQESPSFLKISPDFTEAGGFVNYWHEEDKEHIVWGCVDAQKATSILAFIWLQNILAGGKRWRRREIGSVPASFRDVLPMGYMCISKPNQPIVVKAMGARVPLVRLKDGGLLGASDWLQAPGMGGWGETVTPAEVAEIILPEPMTMAMGMERVMSMNATAINTGFSWQLTQLPTPAMLGLYPSSMGMQIDRFQEGWKSWLKQNIPQMDSERLIEVLICLRESVINADKHGCGGVFGKRVLVMLQNDTARHFVKVRVSDPGKGHRHNLNTASSREDQKLGKHLGLMLIHGLSSMLRFSDAGATIEFDFNY